MNHSQPESYWLENLSDALLQTFIEQQGFEVPAEAYETFAAITGVEEARRNPQGVAALYNFTQLLQNVIAGYSQGVFVRLGALSPKDSAPPASLRCYSVQDMMERLALSERVREEVAYAYEHKLTPTIFIRPWMDIQPWQEIRCLIKNGALYGLTQYFINKKNEFPEYATHGEKIAGDIHSYMANTIIPLLEHADVCVDVVYSKDSIKLIDYNPLTVETDLCFFSNQFPVPQAPEFRFGMHGKVHAIRLSS